MYYIYLTKFYITQVATSQITTVKILQDLFAAEVGVGMTMVGFGRNKRKVASGTPGVL